MEFNKSMHAKISAISSTNLNHPVTLREEPSCNKHGKEKMPEVENEPLRLVRMDVGHSSLKTKTRRDSKRRLCRHNSDSGANFAQKDMEILKHQHYSRGSSRRKGRRVKRSVSALEGERPACVRKEVRRSISERSNPAVGRYLLPPMPQCRRPDSVSAEVSDGHSSRCSKASSARTAASNASISEVMAVEMGLKDIPGLTCKEARRRRVVCTVATIAVTLLLLSVLLVAVTLLLSPAVDAVLRKENEEIYRVMPYGPSTPAPDTDGAPGNDTTSDGQPG